jgi:hypothetical protein
MMKNQTVLLAQHALVVCVAAAIIVMAQTIALATQDIQVIIATAATTAMLMLVTLAAASILNVHPHNIAVRLMHVLRFPSAVKELGQIQERTRRKAMKMQETNVALQTAILATVQVAVMRVGYTVVVNKALAIVVIPVMMQMLIAMQ